MSYDFDIYLAGPMTGKPDFNRPAFNAAEAKYAALGYRVFNPAKNGLPPGSPWREHMRVDIAALVRSRSVLLLDGWRRSRGALIEHSIAVTIGSEVFFDTGEQVTVVLTVLGEPLAPQHVAPAEPSPTAGMNAIELAEQLEAGAAFPAYPPMPLRVAAAMLRKQHGEIERLRVEIAPAQIEHSNEGVGP